MLSPGQDNAAMKGSFRFVMLGLVAATVVLAGLWQMRPAAPLPIKIGVLHSLSGTMALSESPLVDAVRLAVEEINAQGGLLGRPLELVVADGKSDANIAAAEAERLIMREQVAVLFGCWTSSCRKAVKPVVEQHQHLLFYPVQYEGMEQSPNILYTGAAPNQQVVPGTRWAMQQFGRRVYLLGSDYVYPRTANLIMRDLVKANGGEVLAERYLPLGSADVEAIVADIMQKKPDIVLNTLNGDSNLHFLDALEKAGLRNLPLISFSMAEGEMKAWRGGRFPRHYAVWGYFQSLPGEENRRFVAAYQSRFGAERVISAPMEASYRGVRLWVQAVREVNSPAPAQIDKTLLRQSIQAPSGILAVDASSRHLWNMVRVGRALPDGQFEQVYASSAPVRPTPWPLYRSQDAWQALLENNAARETP
jgi:urea transport system substrate-binding protein